MKTKEKEFLLLTLAKLSYTMEDCEITEEERCAYALATSSILYRYIDMLEVTDYNLDNVKIIGGK